MEYASSAVMVSKFGLYTSFVDFLLYFAFASLKDITVELGGYLDQLRFEDWHMSDHCDHDKAGV